MASKGKPGVTVVNISSLSLPQLDQLKNSLEEDINLLTSSMAQLKLVQQKFVESKSAVEYMTPSTEGGEILVPLTSSMYVPGILRHDQKFICDIGTGYFVEKEQKDAVKFFERKIEYVTSNIEKLQHGLKEKHGLRENVLVMMQTRIQTQLASGSQTKS